MKRTIFSLAVLVAALISARAGYVTPVSYTATPGQGTGAGGSYEYFDDGGVQLTDGLLGADNWAADLGHGNAYEWVGWRTVDPVLVFLFGTSARVTAVEIGFNRAEGAGIYLPTQVEIGGNTFPVDREAIANGTRGWLTFGGDWATSALEVDLTRRFGLWAFVEEIKFVGAVPDAGSAFALLGGAIALVGAAGRNSRR